MQFLLPLICIIAPAQAAQMSNSCVSCLPFSIHPLDLLVPFGSVCEGLWSCFHPHISCFCTLPAMQVAHSCLLTNDSACPPEICREPGVMGTLGLSRWSLIALPLTVHSLSLLVLTQVSSCKRPQEKTRSWRHSCGYFSQKDLQDASEREKEEGNRHVMNTLRYNPPRLTQEHM